jgi:hypothetical protein
VHRVAQRVHDGPDLGRDPIEPHHIGRGHRDELGERAVPVDADDLGALAQVGGAQAALQAVPADNVALGGDQVPDREQPRGLAFAAELDDLARELVADHDRGPKPVTGPAVPLPDMEVGTADTCVVDTNHDVAGTAGRNGDIPHDHAGARGWLDECAHRGSERSRGNSKGERE